MAIVREKTECACNICKNMCRHTPCFPIPTDVQALITAGYKNRLQASIYSGSLHGREFMWPIVAPLHIEGHGCTFFTKEGMCELHQSGLKPMEGKLAIHNKADDGLRKAICFTWASPLGIELMKQFDDSKEIIFVLTELMQQKQRK